MDRYSMQEEGGKLPMQRAEEVVTEWASTHTHSVVDGAHSGRWTV